MTAPRSRPAGSPSIVITCRDDARLFPTIASVDADVEVVVVLNGSPPAFAARVASLADPRVRVEQLDLPHRARAVEHGIRTASHDEVLLLDADCTLDPGSIAAVQHAFATGDPRAEVYKGTIVYESGRSFASRVVALSRTQRNQRLSAYKPALALSRTLRDVLGGHLFDPRLVWKSDAELDQRVRTAGLRVVAVPGCVVRHAPLTVASDLRSSFGYGVGAALAARHGLDVPPAERSVRDAWRRDGAAAGLYMAVSNGARRLGRTYAAVRLRLSAGRWPAPVRDA